MALKGIVNLKVVGAEDEQISVVTSNIQEIKTLKVVGGFIVQMNMVSGRYFTIIDSSGEYKYNTEALAKTAKAAFIATLQE